MSRYSISRAIFLSVLVLDLFNVSNLLVEQSEYIWHFLVLGTSLSWLGAALALRHRFDTDGVPGVASARSLLLEGALGMGFLLLGLLASLGLSILFVFFFYYLAIITLFFPVLLLAMLAIVVASWLLLELLRLLPFLVSSLILVPIVAFVSRGAMSRRDWRNGCLGFLFQAMGLWFICWFASNEAPTCYELLIYSALRWQNLPFGILAGVVVYSGLGRALGVENASPSL